MNKTTTGATILGAIVFLGWMSSAFAQAGQPAIFERIPEIDYREQNQVDLQSGMVRFGLPLLSIGDPKRPLTLSLNVAVRHGSTHISPRTRAAVALRPPTDSTSTWG